MYGESISTMVSTISPMDNMRIQLIKVMNLLPPNFRCHHQRKDTKARNRNGIVERAIARPVRLFGRVEATAMMIRPSAIKILRRRSIQGLRSGIGRIKLPGCVKR